MKFQVIPCQHFYHRSHPNNKVLIWKFLFSSSFFKKSIVEFSFSIVNIRADLNVFTLSVKISDPLIIGISSVKLIFSTSINSFLAKEDGYCFICFYDIVDDWHFA